jgi:hypothetical protein
MIKHQPPPRRPGLLTQTGSGQQIRSSTAHCLDPAADFNDCLNAVHNRVKFTREEEVDGAIAFLDVHLTRLPNGKITTCIYRKPSNTNIITGPTSCQEPTISISTFKSELCRAHRLCTSPTQTKKEIRFTLDVFEDNGHNRHKLSTIAEGYTPPPINGPKPANSSSAISRNLSSHQPEQIPSNLFDILPFNDCDPHGCPSDDTPVSQPLSHAEAVEQQRRPYACLPYIPGISNQLKRTLNKAGCKTFFKSGKKLRDILCSKNKTHPPQKDKKGIYKITCPCSPKSTYIGQTSRSINTRITEHKKATERQQWHHSGITQHKETCNLPVDWDDASTITTLSNKNKVRLKYDLKIREALEIRRHDCGPGRGLNED